MKSPIAFVTILTAGALMAQTSAPAQEGSANHQGRALQGMLQRMTKDLNLTADQQNQVKNILQSSREQTKALQPKLREERSALRDAVKTDAEQKIDQITRQNAELNAEASAIHAKTMAKIYTVLTPEQKAKFDQRFENGFWRHRDNARRSNRG
jgi:Spy/CpxP family protein refolding chaperone